MCKKCKTAEQFIKRHGVSILESGNPENNDIQDMINNRAEMPKPGNAITPGTGCYRTKPNRKHYKE